MEKTALVELNESNLKMTIYRVNGNKSEVCLTLSQNFPVGKEIESDELLSPKTRKDIIDMLKIYRKVIEDYSVSSIHAFMSNVIVRARNYHGFLDEIYNNTGVNFAIVGDEECVKYVFSSVVGSIDIAKGVFVYVDQYKTYVVKYNRRAVLGFITLPFGAFNAGEYGKNPNEIVENLTKQIMAEEFVKDIDEETKIVGRAFVSTGKIAKKIQRYPLDIDNNYLLTSDILSKTFDFVNGLELDKIRKIKGIDFDDADKVVGGMAVVKALFNALKSNEMVVSTASVRHGVLTNDVLYASQEKVSDILSCSLDNYYEFSKDEFSINYDVYETALLLFKQLKVMHKLPRFYVKPLKIASFMYDCGKYIDRENYSRYSLDKILYSDIKGATHRELLIAGFIDVCQNLDEFSLNEWIKYKDILTDEDLDAVRKLGIIVKLAVALNASRKHVINDILCDILGDSIIMKTVTETDASFEILEGMKVAQDYRKVYKKSLQII